MKEILKQRIEPNVQKKYENGMRFYKQYFQNGGEFYKKMERNKYQRSL